MNFSDGVGVNSEKRAGSVSATALVVASMIGVGVFTSLGFQLEHLDSGPQVMFLWLLGGVIALCGAVCYMEVAALRPKSGGEYHFLKSIYHPSLGFMAGMVSAFAGFAAPTAITALAFGKYLHSAWEAVPVTGAAVGVILVGACAHAVSVRTSAGVQVVATALKLVLIAGFIVAACLLPGAGDVRWTLDLKADAQAVWQPAFAVSLLYVTYSYTGWNAAVYGLEEWRDPQRTVTRALLWGTLLVTALYLGLNAAFLHAAPSEALRGKEAVGHIAAVSLFGESAARVVSGLFALGLFASASAMLWAGPRVLGAMGLGMRSLSFFAPRGEVPHRALFFQTGVALVLVVVTKLRDLMEATQVALTLSTSLVVAGCMVLRRRERDAVRPVKVPLYPLPPLIFLVMAGFILVYSTIKNPGTTLQGAGVAVLFALLWFPLQRFQK